MQKRQLAVITLGWMLCHSTASAQTNNLVTSLSGSPAPADSATGVVGLNGTALPPEFTPLTESERLRRYFMSAFGPGAILRASVGAGIAQWQNTPKEWRQGAEAYGDRFGNSLAQHVIRTTLESGAAAVLHEDNRYIRSTDSGFWKRSKHAIGSVFVARNDAGQKHFAYSRFGGAAGSSFISRIWQPPSTNSSGDAAVNFGLSMLTDMGWNVFREFHPARFGR